VRIHVEHDAAMLARLSGAAAPACDGLILKHGQPNEVLAATIRGNILAHDSLIDTEMPGDRIVCWSGTLADELFAAYPANWLRPGREALQAFCREVAGQFRSHQRTICFQPHSRHVLSDAQSCLSLLREHDGGPFEIALSPATMLEASMLNDLEDHLARMFQSLGGQCALVMLSDVAESLDDEGEPMCESVPLGQGRLPRELVRGLIREHVPATTPIVLRPQQIASQLEWLGDLA